MAPSRFQRTSAVLLAATLAATSSAVEFGGENDVTQSAGTVSPGGETQTSTAASSFGNTDQWTQTASSSNNVPTMAPSVASSGSQGWTQPTPADTPSVWTSSSGQASGTGDHWGTLLECSGSDDASKPNNDVSLECSGSSEETPSVATSTAGSSNFTPTTTTAPTTSSGIGQTQPSSTASSSNTASSGKNEDAVQMSSTQSSSDATTSTAASGTADQGSSQATQTSTESSSTTESSSNTAQSTASSSNTATSTASSSNTASSATQGGSDATQGGSDATQTSGNSTSSGNHATFGTVTSKSGECVIGNPNAYVSTADIDWIWENRIGPDAPTRDANWNVADNKNWIMDHIVHNKGSLNYCVRWDSTKKLSKTVASKFKAMLERQYAAWNEWLIGYGCWPYDEIKVNLVGFAVKDASLLDWTDDSLGTITVGDLDSEGVPQCDQSCYRFYDVGLQTWTDTSSCKGEPFDLSLWPKQGLEGGFGYDWGQEVNLENMLSTVDEDQLVIVAHEIGHGFGLPDFYEDADKPNAQWPSCIMMAGSSMTVTPSDGWMLRRVLEHIKSRYNF
uniref:Neutral zinc metallopeptidase, Zn-binding site n=1 Tax=Phytophthora ramorum TaxID=164328 RepID=H3GN36_PHYRM